MFPKNYGLAFPLLMMCAAAFATADPSSSLGTKNDFSWLDSPTDPAALKWAHDQTERTRAAFGGADFEDIRSATSSALAGSESLPFIFAHGPYLFTWRKGDGHPQGVLARTAAKASSAKSAQWDDLLDLDALGKKEGTPWTAGRFDVECLPPKFDRCLLPLSPDGGDHVVVREFDAATHRFVENGFAVPLALTSAHWVDIDHILVASDFGPGSLNAAGLPKQVRLWTRGKPISSATLVVDGLKTDLGIDAVHDSSGSHARTVITIEHKDERSELIVRNDDDGRLVPLRVPAKGAYAVHGDWVAMLLKSDWEANGRKFPSGSLLIANVDDTMKGPVDYSVVFEPSGGNSVVDFRWTPSHLVISTLESASTHVLIASRTTGKAWVSEEAADVPPFNFIEIGASPDTPTEEYWLRISGFLNPGQLVRADAAQRSQHLFASTQPAFDASHLEVTQHFATSRDGTRVPYFQVSRKGLPNDGRNPTLMYGYGGFSVPVVPLYHPEVGAGWLARGGVYVSANIRGGSEFGPAWHDAATGRNKARSYEDFAAIARDLVARGVTSPAHLGAYAASNGGLLIGNMLTGYPELFGALDADVPVLDLRTFVKQGSGPLWIAEYGNPDLPADWAFMQKISVLQNLREGRPYPPVLLTTATSDDRVGPGQAREAAAKLQALGYTHAWFAESDLGGHGGGDRNQLADNFALRYSFFWKHLK